MKRAIIFLLLLPLAALAQQPDAKPPARIESVHTSVLNGEVRVDIETSGPVDGPGFVAAYADELVWDLPGASYTQMGERIQINQADVRDVRVWMQRQAPAITRISVGMNRDKVYALMQEGNHVILRIGPGTQVAANRNRTAPPKQEAITVIPAGRTRRSVAATVGAIFTSEPKQPIAVSRSEASSRAPAPIEASQPLSPAQPGNIATVPSPAPQDATVPAAAPAAIASATHEQTPAPPLTSTTTANVIPTSNELSTPTIPPNIKDSISPSAVNATGTTAPMSATAVATATVPVPAEPPEATPAPKETPGEPSIGPATPAEPTVAAVTPKPTAESTPAATAKAAILSAAIVPAMPPTMASETPAASADPTAASLALAAPPPMANVGIRTTFHIKFVQEDSAYIDGGRTAGLTEGMKLLVSAPDTDGNLPKGLSTDAAVAELVVVGVAETSAVTEIRVPKRDVVHGDLAYFTTADVESMVQQRSLSATRKYPVVISFTEEDDALDEEARVQDVPRAPLPSVNRMEGRLGFDYIGTQNLGSAPSTGKDVGVVIRADFTRIGGTYWNFRGYWRGRIDSYSANTQPTLQDLINRTYHLALTYENPESRWVAGFGRLLLPWAVSLDTIDGGYFGRRLRPGIIAGVFAGSTPDPTSWNYNPDQRIGGAFLNFTGGSFDALHYSSTTGAGENMLKWTPNRPMLFFENGVSYRRNFSIFHSLQADSPAGNAATTAPGAGIGRSFFTTRWSPFSRLELDFNHTYFRNVPTFDPRLVGTGLLDKYLFQGFSGGGRVSIVKQISVYTELGRSSRSGDNTGALNTMYGITWGRVPWLAARADVHYSRFNSSFGSGSYEAVSLTRSFRGNLRLDLLGGTQAFTSTLAGNQTAKFVTTTVDSNLGAMLFLQGSFTIYRGQQQSYNQWMTMIGYRFDSKWRHR